MFDAGTQRHRRLDDFLGRNVNGNKIIYIGTDSKNTNVSKFSTVIAVYNPGRGGILFKRVFCERKIVSLRERLWKEAWYSVEMGLVVADLVSDSVKIEIHLDVNSNRKHKSAQYAQLVIGLVTGQGFACRIKPDAWCATCIADKVIRQQ